MDIASISAMATEVNQFASILGSPNPISPAPLLAILSTAFSYASGEFGIRAAQAWGNNYRFPPDILQRDATAFAACGSNLTTFCQHRQDQMQHSRLTLRRVHNTFIAYYTI
jgi:hypothetical protein